MRIRVVAAFPADFGADNIVSMEGLLTNIFQTVTRGHRSAYRTPVQEKAAIAACPEMHRSIVRLYLFRRVRFFETGSLREKECVHLGQTLERITFIAGEFVNKRDMPKANTADVFSTTYRRPHLSVYARKPKEKPGHTVAQIAQSIKMGPSLLSRAGRRSYTSFVALH